MAGWVNVCAGLQLDDLQRCLCLGFLAFGLGFALFPGTAFDGGAPAALGEDLLNRVHQVLAIEPGLKTLGVDHAFGKQVGSAGHFQTYRSGGAVEG